MKVYFGDGDRLLKAVDVSAITGQGPPGRRYLVFSAAQEEGGHQAIVAFGDGGDVEELARRLRRLL